MKTLSATLVLLALLVGALPLHGPEDPEIWAALETPR
jgi:hypothetical protein